MIRTVDDLVSSIAEDLIWRRRELTVLKSMVEQYKNDPMRLQVTIRAAIPLLYAHWEGFVKQCSTCYVEYVSLQRLPYKKLSANFVAFALKTKFIEFEANKKVSSGKALAEFFCTKMEAQSKIPYKNAIDTQSNLSSLVLIDIIEILGLDVSHFETRLKYIDKNLVSPRNHVAHGQVLDISYKDYFELHESVLSLIETFRNLVENASISRDFERND